LRNASRRDCLGHLQLQQFCRSGGTCGEADYMDLQMKSFGSGRATHLLRKSIDMQLFCLDDING